MNFGVCRATVRRPDEPGERRLVAQRAVVDRPQLAAGAQHPGRGGEEPVGGGGHDRRADVERRIADDEVDAAVGHGRRRRRPGRPGSGRRGRWPPRSRRPRRPPPPTGRRRARSSSGRLPGERGGEDAGAAAQVQGRAGRRRHAVQRSRAARGCRCRSSCRRTPRRARTRSARGRGGPGCAGRTTGPAAGRGRPAPATSAGRASAETSAKESRRTSFIAWVMCLTRPPTSTVTSGAAERRDHLGDLAQRLQRPWAPGPAPRGRRRRARAPAGRTGTRRSARSARRCGPGPARRPAGPGRPGRRCAPCSATAPRVSAP